MNQENIDNYENENQKAYREYYREQSEKAKKNRIFLFLLPFLMFISLFSAYIILGQLQYTLHILFIVGCLVSMGIIAYFVNRSSKLLFIPIILLLAAGFLISYVLLLDSIIEIDMAIVFYYSYVILLPILLGLIYRGTERKSSDCADDVVQYITPRIDENHTAVILEHNANRVADGGDINVIPLIKVLKRYNENFQIYLCLYEDNIVKVLTNPYVKRIWIFGHGERGGFKLTDKFFSYENFMKEHDTELREIGPREYVYQCHCNTGSEKPLTDCLLKERKGLLDQNIDNMPNFF